MKKALLINKAIYIMQNQALSRKNDFCKFLLIFKFIHVLNKRIYKLLRPVKSLINYFL